jgi:hypothetical protein
MALHLKRCLTLCSPFQNWELPLSLDSNTDSRFKVTQCLFHNWWHPLPSICWMPLSPRCYQIPSGIRLYQEHAIPTEGPKTATREGWMEASNSFQNFWPLSPVHRQEQDTMTVHKSKIPKPTSDKSI